MVRSMLKISVPSALCTTIREGSLALLLEEWGGDCIAVTPDAHESVDHYVYECENANVEGAIRAVRRRYPSALVRQSRAASEDYVENSWKLVG